GPAADATGRPRAGSARSSGGGSCRDRAGSRSPSWRSGLCRTAQAARPERMVGMGIGMMPVIMAVMVPMIMVVRMSGADAFHVMVVAPLRQTDLILEAEHLRAVFAHLAVHGVGAGKNLVQPVLQHLGYQRMIAEVAGLDEFDLRMVAGDEIGMPVNALDEDAGEEEIGKH